MIQILKLSPETFANAKTKADFNRERSKSPNEIVERWQRKKVNEIISNLSENHHFLFQRFSESPRQNTLMQSSRTVCVCVRVLRGMMI